MTIMGSHDFTIEGHEEAVRLKCEQATWAVEGVLTGESWEVINRNETDEADKVDLEG